MTLRIKYKINVILVHVLVSSEFGCAGSCENGARVDQNVPSIVRCWRYSAAQWHPVASLRFAPRIISQPSVRRSRAAQRPARA